MKRKDFPGILAVFAAALLFAASSLYAAGPAPVTCHRSRSHLVPGFRELGPECEYSCEDGGSFSGWCSEFSSAVMWRCPGTSLRYSSRPKKGCPTKAEWEAREKKRKAEAEKQAKKFEAETKKKMAERKKLEKDTRKKNLAENGGSFIDSRDGKTYKTIRIGNQVWMAENLNYVDSVANPGLMGRTSCYDDKQENCDKYGAMYTWAAAVDSLTTGCGKPSGCELKGAPIQGICPDGWHVPTYDEFGELVNFVSKGKNLPADYSVYYDERYATIQALNTPRWKRATDMYGLNLVPSGVFENANDGYAGIGWYATLWSIKGTPALLKDPAHFDLSDDTTSRARADIVSGNYYKDSRRGLRCVQGEGRKVSDIKVPEKLLDDDGNEYPVVQVGAQIWMAKNLELNTMTSKCYEDKEACKRLGRYYSEEELPNVCPLGWRIPTVVEWENLLERAGSKEALMRKGEKNWKNATDKIGFSAAPAGYVVLWPYKNKIDKIPYVGREACFWVNSGEYTQEYSEENNSLTPYLSFYPKVRCLGASDLNASELSNEHQYSVRCVLDDYEGQVAIEKKKAARDAYTKKRREGLAKEKQRIQKILDGCKAPNGCKVKDERDEKTYSAITIGEQVWLSENMEYIDGVENTRCSYGNNLSKDCFTLREKRSGILYSDAENLELICPDGWHIPSRREFMALVNAAGGLKKAGGVLKSNQKSTGFFDSGYVEWKDNGNGTDALHFGILPTGYAYYDENAGMWNEYQVAEKERIAVMWLDDGSMAEFSSKTPEITIVKDKYIGATARCVRNMD